MLKTSINLQGGDRLIEVLRIDDRLLHGQVAATWIPFLGVDTILIANDMLIKDKTMQIAFKLAKPAGVTLSMKSLDGAVEVINNPKHKDRKIMVIVGSPQDAEYLCKHTKGINNVVIGGQRDGKGKKKIDITVYLDDKDMKSLYEISKLGIEIISQAVPTSPKLSYEEIEKQFKKQST